VRVVDNNIGLSPFAGPGAWNDPDMLEVGNGGMSTEEYKSHFALWCLLKSPLLIGCNLDSISTDDLATLTASELIAVNQDSLGVQGDLIWQVGPIQVWAAPLHDGSRAVVLFNRHTTGDVYPTNITVKFTDLGYPSGTSAVVRDLYEEKDIGTFKGSYTAEVLAHSSFAGKVSPVHMQPDYVLWRPWHKQRFFSPPNVY